MPSISLPGIPRRAIAWGALGAVAALALVLVVLGGPWSSERPGSVAGTVSPDLPPPGTVWFGRSFDRSTFEMPSRVPTARTGESIAYVARLIRPGNGLTVRTVIGGVRATIREVEVSDEADIAGGTIELSAAGLVGIEIVDGSGAVLASGTFVVTD